MIDQSRNSAWEAARTEVWCTLIALGEAQGEGDIPALETLVDVALDHLETIVQAAASADAEARCEPLTNALAEVQDKLQVMANHHERIEGVTSRPEDAIPWLQGARFLVDYLPTIDAALADPSQRATDGPCETCGHDRTLHGYHAGVADWVCKGCAVDERAGLQGVVALRGHPFLGLLADPPGGAS